MDSKTEFWDSHLPCDFEDSKGFFRLAPHLGSENTTHPWRPLSLPKYHRLAETKQTSGKTLKLYLGTRCETVLEYRRISEPSTDKRPRKNKRKLLIHHPRKFDERVPENDEPKENVSPASNHGVNLWVSDDSAQFHGGRANLTPNKNLMLPK